MREPAVGDEDKLADYGFRSIVFRDRDEVEIGSRNERPMTRYFPELVAAIKAELPERCVIDGEIVVADAAGQRLDFEALQEGLVVIQLARPPGQRARHDLIDAGRAVVAALWRRGPLADRLN